MNVRNFACEWQDHAKPEDSFPDNFNQIHPYLILNISRKMAKPPQQTNNQMKQIIQLQTSDTGIDCIFLLKKNHQKVGGLGVVFFLVKLSVFIRILKI